MKIKVYRLEHKLSGLGPFEHGSQYASIVKSLTFHKDPDTYKDQYSKHTKNHVFGWTSEEAILNFIKPNREGLFVRYKFTRNIYEVDEQAAIVYPDGQVSFLKAKAQLICEIPFQTKAQKRKTITN